MSFDAPTLLAGLFVSSIGFVLLSYGKKQSRPPQLLAGLLLMVFPYFVSSPLIVFLIAGVLLGALWVVVKSGY